MWVASKSQKRQEMNSALESLETSSTAEILTLAQLRPVFDF